MGNLNQTSNDNGNKGDSNTKGAYDNGGGATGTTMADTS
jgi:hypothetical protein